MKAIICDNNINIIIQKLQDFLDSDGIIKGVYLADHNNDQIVLLIGNSPINEEAAKIWWNGYSEGMKAIL